MAATKRKPLPDPVWIEAPTSGILHVAGEGVPLRSTVTGIRLLCGWVIQPDSKDVRSRTHVTGEQKCVGCLSWLAKHGGRP